MRSALNLILIFCKRALSSRTGRVMRSSTVEVVLRGVGTSWLSSAIFMFLCTLYSFNIGTRLPPLRPTQSKGYGLECGTLKQIYQIYYNIDTYYNNKELYYNYHKIVMTYVVTIIVSYLFKIRNWNAVWILWGVINWWCKIYDRVTMTWKVVLYAQTSRWIETMYAILVRRDYANMGDCCDIHIKCDTRYYKYGGITYKYCDITLDWSLNILSQVHA